MKTNKNFKLLPQFIMTNEEVKQYNELPQNLPDTKLTAKQIEFVSSLYYKYIGRPIDQQSYYKPMFKIEQGENWPSGPRIKQHEAQRIILNNLVERQDKKTLTFNVAAKTFFGALTCRPMYSQLLAKIYNY